MRVGLSAFGTTFMMGLHPQSSRPPITPDQFIDYAVEAGLSGVEMPLSLLKGADVPGIARRAREQNLFITLAADGYDPNHLSEVFDVAVSLGAGTVRTVVGGAKFGGDRREMEGKWDSFLQAVLTGLETAVRIAENKGITLALENHQDVASEELIWLCEKIGSSHFGITLDTGNPLATAEEPVDFAKRIASYVKHVHLKDYWVYLTEEGYKLVRCPIGQGVVDFPALLPIFSSLSSELTMSIEIGALEARHTRVLADDYWREYPARSAQQLAKVMRFVQSNAKPQGDWKTPYENGESVRSITQYENAQLLTSIAYVHGLMRTLKQSETEVTL
ncbi:sugar phosphate isomerase/epimerase family protein [Paenibacillus gansuensis]|uniref:Sugar phosphate isomerase/epimerase family protein n=1 Tax=Paenibacillus gansuensis TaxID=306542 RepID=A0ABW5PC79_9BACL